MLRVEAAALLFLAGLLGCGRAPKSERTAALLGAGASSLALGVFLAARISILVGLGALAGEIGIDVADFSPRAGRLLTLVAAVAAFGLSCVVAGLLPEPAPWLRRRLWDRLTEGGVKGAERLTTAFSPLPRPIRETFRVLMAGGMDGLVPSSMDAAAIVLAIPSGGADLGMLALFAYGVGGLFTASPNTPERLAKARRVGAALAFLVLAATDVFRVLSR